MDYRRYYSQHGHVEWTIDALDRLKVITSENFINAIELNKKLYFACKNEDQVDPLILKIRVEELIKNGATNDYLEGFHFRWLQIKKIYVPLSVSQLRYSLTI